MMRYRVLVDDNFHYMDEDHRYEAGEYETADEAIAACRKIVDSSLEENHQSDMSAAGLYFRYTQFGEDPFIVTIGSASPDIKFSGWNYAKERSEVMCARRVAAEVVQSQKDGG